MSEKATNPNVKKKVALATAVLAGASALAGCASDADKLRDEVVHNPDAVKIMTSREGKDVEGVTIIRVADPESGIPLKYAATINNESGDSEDRRSAIRQLGTIMNEQDQGFPGVETGDMFVLPTDKLSDQAIEELAVSRQQARQILHGK